MTFTMQFKQCSHLDPVLTDPATRTLHADKLVGHWINTNHEACGIAACVIEQKDETFSVSLTGVGADGPLEWPVVGATLLANLEEEASQRSVALCATFEFGFMKADTYMRVNRGVLVIVLYITFLDQSSRSNYVNREFFYCQS